MKTIVNCFLLTVILFAMSTTTIAQANTFTAPNSQQGQNLSLAVTDQNTHFTQGSPTLTSITPDNGLQGQSLPVTITGQNTHFAQGSGTMGVWFSQGSPTVNIFASSYSASSDTSLTANFDIPVDAALGFWDVHVSDDIDGILTLTDGFKIYCLKNGDLLLCRSYKSFIPNVDFWTHVGIYHQPSNTVIEARAHPDWVVSIYPLTDWFYPNQTCVEILRVKTDDSTRNKAVKFALDKVGQSFDWCSLLLNKKQEGGECYLCKKWYCSELVWAAYLSASNGQINLDQDKTGLVSPDDVNSDDDVEMIGEHKEAIPQRAYWHVLWGEAYSPVDLEITDPDGLILNKQGSTILGGTYEEFDVDENGDLEDLFVIPEPKVGSYLIQVIPEPNTLPTDTYSLEVTINDQTIVLAEDVQVSEIPDEPYLIQLTEAGIDAAPVADAGPNQTAYAWIDGIAEVNLDGSDSNDPDGDELTYSWSWVIDGITYETNSVNPVIELPVGAHTIKLVVNDGLLDSEPNYVDVNVIAQLKAGLCIIPSVVNRSDHLRNIMALMELPKGIKKADVNDEPFVLYPAGSEEGIEAERQYVYTKWRRRVAAVAQFSKSELMDAVPNNGRVRLLVVGQLNSGQYFFGSDTIRIIDRHWRWNEHDICR